LKQEVDGNDISVLENPKVKELIKLELKKRVQDRPNFVQFERISNFRLLERELSQEEGFVTQTGKIRRNNVFEYYKDVIETMYSNV
jgi:long-chain acyl-CoA synthetase